MIDFTYEADFELINPNHHVEWIQNALQEEGFEEGDINYIFCDDEYLHKLNVEFLDHDTLTDIISFDYTMGKLISGDIFISVERVFDNAKDLNIDFRDEMNRVMIHGILHYCGYKDKQPDDVRVMRSKEDYYIAKIAK
ncbi:rRNA maturation RNase YbeY [Wenyingzhuangia aestuarii]|uniref:rRNA maturation RNase YbeY n=1 Tax=Wenyingzhuangia aestuarii TaxID=1647582 RepID=UPI001438C8A9|nr:rRNA maturation RNase YbeY [Wenyingzhuangia aestuarii]NJB81255.1 rRNA maturation RNase YbeY [Wenyingzhuangia aestuarii]